MTFSTTGYARLGSDGGPSLRRRFPRAETGATLIIQNRSFKMSHREIRGLILSKPPRLGGISAVTSRLCESSARGVQLRFVQSSVLILSLNMRKPQARTQVARKHKDGCHRHNEN